MMKRLHRLPFLCFILIAALMAPLLTSCTSGDQKAAQQVKEYFAGKGARFVTGITVENVQVTNAPEGRTLTVRFVSVEPGGETASFLSLYYGSADMQGGWMAELNQAGLNIAFVDMAFDYKDGTPPETLVANFARQSIMGGTRLRPGPPTTLRR